MSKKKPYPKTLMKYNSSSRAKFRDTAQYRGQYEPHLLRLDKAAQFGVPLLPDDPKPGHPVPLSEGEP